MGLNRLPEPRRTGILRLLLTQFQDLMILILLAAAVAAAAIGEPQDSITILVIVALNAVIGTVQQYRAENALAALRSLSAPSATVRRDGEHRVIDAAQLVPGDIVELEAGSVVPADLRLLLAADLEVDESMLTGESQPVAKRSECLEQEPQSQGDRVNEAFRGTLITRGRGQGLVVATGSGTQMGAIARMLSMREILKSPLQRRLVAFGKRLSIAILVICALLFLSGVLRGEPWMLMLLTAISLAVAAIPEALPAVVSICLAIGAYRMSRINTLVRSLPAVETLGSVSVICSDKTGTLTENRMHLERVVTASGLREELPPPGEDSATLANRFGQCLALNNDVTVGRDGEMTGDPTEIALMAAAAEAGFERAGLETELPRVAEAPFTSERQRMTSLHGAQDQVIAFSKGAPEVMIPLCRDVLTESGTSTLDARHWQDQVTALAEAGYRVLALAFRELPGDERDPVEALESELTLLGLVGLMDPPRQEVPDAVAECVSAGILPIMITGDHPGTALAIARRLGIAEGPDQVLTGVELAKTGERELESLAERIRVYARVSPEQKIQLVKALQARGQFVAMTGDGVNDAPALKRADIGIAMGLGGTDVARQAAAMVLLDDNFATIVAAVREGRRIFDNIRKFIKYTMTSNSGEIWTLALAPLFGLPLPLLPIHILWINLVTDGLPGLALTTQREERGIMGRPPRPPRESMFSGGIWQHILFFGLLIAGLTLSAQFWAIQQNIAAWQTMAFTVLTFTQLVHVIMIRNETDSIFATGLLQNPALLGAVGFTVLLQLLVIYVPLFNTIFRTAPLGATEIGICVSLPLILVFLSEGEKWLMRRGILYSH